MGAHQVADVAGSHTWVAEPRQFADVEYFGTVYRDAELISDIWHFYDSFATFAPFVAQVARKYAERAPGNATLRRRGPPGE